MKPRKLPVCVTAAVSLFPFVPYPLFFFHQEKLELAPGGGIYAGANPYCFVAARAEMGAAPGRIADRITLHRDRRRGGSCSPQSSPAASSPFSSRRRLGHSRRFYASARTTRRGRPP